MSTDKTNQSWGGRFSEPVDAFVARFTASVTFDQRLYRHDIMGSVAHATMLAKVGVHDSDEVAAGAVALNNPVPAPFWHGTLNQLQANINDISQRYNKDVIVVETAYGYTTKNFDQMANEYSAGEARRTGFEPMVQGQAGGLRALMARVAAVPNGRGLGVFYWEPGWFPVKGAGWRTADHTGFSMVSASWRAISSMPAYPA